MSSTKRQSPESEQALADLRAELKPGDTVYTIVRHVSRSGMQRTIDLHVIRDNEPRWIGYAAGQALGFRYDDRRQGIIVGGCGMDMGFYVVAKLARRLWPDGCLCLGKDADTFATRCPSSDHVNHRGKKADDWSPTRLHTDSDYFLRQRWI